MKKKTVDVPESTLVFLIAGSKLIAIPSLPGSTADVHAKILRLGFQEDTAHTTSHILMAEGKRTLTVFVAEYNPDSDWAQYLMSVPGDESRPQARKRRLRQDVVDSLIVSGGFDNYYSLIGRPSDPAKLNKFLRANLDYDSTTVFLIGGGEFIAMPFLDESRADVHAKILRLGFQEDTAHTTSHIIAPEGKRTLIVFVDEYNQDSDWAQYLRSTPRNAPHARILRLRQKLVDSVSEMMREDIG